MLLTNYTNPFPLFELGINSSKKYWWSSQQRKKLSSVIPSTSILSKLKAISKCICFFRTLAHNADMSWYSW